MISKKNSFDLAKKLDFDPEPDPEIPVKSDLDPDPEFSYTLNLFQVGSGFGNKFFGPDTLYKQFINCLK
jgi:hypothetical protein